MWAAHTAPTKTPTLKAAKVKQGELITLRLSIADPPPSCGSAVLNVAQTTGSGNQLLRRVKVGQPTNQALVVSHKLRKTPREAISFSVCSAADAAGSGQAQATKVRLKIS